jgi:hypothetical protein
MQTKDFKIRADKDSDPIVLERPHPENLGEMASLCEEGDEGVLTLSTRQWVVDLQSEMRRSWPDNLEGDALLQQLQVMVSEYRYGGARARGPRTKVVDLGDLQIDPAVAELLRKQGVQIAG